jgi:hypothetical protein
MRDPRRLIAASAGLLLLAALGGPSGCGPGDPPPAPPAKRQADSNAGTYVVAFESTPNPIPMNEKFDLRFTVVPKSGSAEGLSVQVDARMPAHGHGMNRVPRVAQQPDGSYRAEGMMFHMPGHWELYVDISRAGKSERAQFDIDLK